MRKGFTLIELLVVIAIIAILAAILFPVFAAARQKGNQTACNSNARQIGIAYYTYTMDNDESFPLESRIDNGSGVYYDNWVDILQPYIRDHQVFFCPGFSHKPALAVNDIPRTAYWTNAYLHRFFPRAWDKAHRAFYRPLKWSQVRFPSTLIAFCEGDVSFGHRAWTINPTNPICGWITYYPDVDWQNTDNRHTGGGNYPFVDGHQKWLLPKAIKTDRAYEPGDPDWESSLIGSGCTNGRNDGTHPWFRP